MRAARQDGSGTDRSRYLDALADERRRETLRVLRDAGVPLSLTDVAMELAGADETTVAADHDRIREEKVALFHCHLPKLTEAGLVEYDAERGTVALAEGVTHVERRGLRSTA